MTYASKQRIRKAAILVASLDGPCSRRLLDGLSSTEGEALRQAVAELGPIDPEERSDILHEFRQSASNSARETDAVEADWSFAAQENSAQFGEPPVRLPPKSNLPISNTSQQKENRSIADSNTPYSFLLDADTRAMAKLLSGEHPQTVAMVMSQLSADLAAELLSNLPAPLQADVIERLAEQHPAEPETVRIVESHLANWFENHRQREVRLLQGQERIQQILAKTSDNHREKLLAQLGRRNGLLVKSITSKARNGHPKITTSLQSDNQLPRAQQEIDLATVVARVRHSSNKDVEDLESCTIEPSGDYLSVEQLPAEDSQPRLKAPNRTTIASVIKNPSQQDFQLTDLAEISNRALLETLKQAKPQIAMLALAGADQKLIDRIANQLPRRQAKQFRRQLGQIEPTRLSDMLSAQQEFAKQAIHIAALE